MTRTRELYHAAHKLHRNPDAPYTEAEKAELLMAIFFARAARATPQAEGE